MSILSIILLVIFVIVCLLLVFMVIIQDSDSDSLGGVFAGGSGSAFGSRSSNVVIRFTYVLGALFFICSFSLAMLNKTSVGNVEKAAQAQQGTEAATSEWWNPSPANSASDSLNSAGQTPAQPTEPSQSTPASGGK